MPHRVDVTLAPVDDNAPHGDILCRVETHERELVGHRATLSIIAHVEVKDSRPVNRSETLFEHEFVLSSIPEEVRIAKAQMRAYSYAGQMIDIKLSTRVVVDDSILFDTKIDEEHELELGLKPTSSPSAKEMIEPKDVFDFFKNLKAIPPDARAFTLVLAAIGVVIVAVNTLIGLHDQFTPDPATWLYTHTDSDGDGQSPFFSSLATSGLAGAFVWLLMRKQLRRYMEFGLRKLPALRRNRTYAVHDLVRGKSRVPLDDVKLRIVACNMELGQYTRGSGSDQRTVSFREPVRGVLLYEKAVEHVPAGVPIGPVFDGRVDLEPMFAALYPPVAVGKSHGLAVHLEVQLLHPEFVDQELVAPEELFDYDDFLQGAAE